MKYFSYNPLPSLRNNSISNVMVWLFTGMWLLLSAGCETDSHAPERIGAEMVLNLRLDTSGMLTRSSDGSGSEDSGLTENESKIDWDDVWIAVFEAESGERIEIVSSEDISGVDIEGKKLRLPIDISGYSGDISIMVLANCSRYGIMASDLDGIYTVQDLKDLTFSFFPDNLKDKDSDIDYFPLPMFGSKTVTAGFPLEKEVVINMTRGLAKIEIVDNLEDGINIDSAILCNYARSGSVISGDQDAVIGTDLVFNRKEEGGKSTFYVYVPEISLGEAESEIRRIRLNLSNGNESEIRLINYTGNQPADSPSSEWDRLRRNYIYRFNVTGLIPSEPEIEIQPTIRVCWYEVEYGRYRGASYVSKKEEMYLHLFSYEDGSDIKYLNYWHDDPVIEAIAEVATEGGLIMNPRYNYYDLEIGDLKFEDIYYIITVLEWRYAIYEKGLFRNLKTDVIKFENINVKEGLTITYCWLNSPPIGYVLDAYRIFPNDKTYRIYWGYGEEDYIVNISDASFDKDEITILNKEYDINKKVWFIDFKVSGSPTSIKLEYANPVTSILLDTYDFTVERINSKGEYYVFYAN